MSAHRVRPTEQLGLCLGTRVQSSLMDWENGAVQYLRQCFSAKDWNVLRRNAEFRAALPSVKTLDDVKRVSALGEKILGSAEVDPED